MSSLFVFFILINKSLFNALAWTAHPCAEPSQVETSCFHLLKELIDQEKRTEITKPHWVGVLETKYPIFSRLNPNSKLILM